MKHKTHHLNNLFYPRGWIIIALLLFSAVALAQEQTPPDEFVLGATTDRYTRYEPVYYNLLRASGMNFLSQYADETTNGYLDGLNFIAFNGEHPYEWIQFYSTSFYSKWEAEEDQIEKYKVGFKHREDLEDSLLGNPIGSPAIYPPNNGRQCWSTEGLTAPACSLMYGPHYFQGKVYKRWYDQSYNYDRFNLRYTPRFIMALDVNDTTIQLNEDVCRIYVVARYREVENGQYGPDQDSLFMEKTLKVSDFLPFGTFVTKYLENNGNNYYIYPEEWREPEGGNFEDFVSTDVYFFDKWGDEGIQFCVDWLRNDTKCNLYIDYVEVYDNDGWNKYINDPQLVVDSIVAYAQRFPNQDWQNMKYWGGCDEPASLDTYVPIKTVDSILDSIGAPRLITTFNPWWEETFNGDNQIERFYNTVQPERLIIDFFPFNEWRDPAGFGDWETTRKKLQTCSELQPGFYFQAQRDYRRG